MCNNCPIRSGSISGYEACPGNLSAEVCMSRLQGVIKSMSWDLNYLVRMTDGVRPCDNTSLPAIREALDNLPIPAKPSCLPDGEWNMEVIGNHSMGYTIIVDDHYVNISNAEAHILKGYAKAIRKEDERAERILRGEGIHQEGICPVCGGTYEPWKNWSSGANPLNHNWRCPDCGASGRTVYESEFIGHVDLVDGNGTPVETPEYENHDMYTCPCCGERFEPEDFDSEGYWDHGSGSYGMHGCRAHGRMMFSHKFKYHADLRANRKKVY